MKLNFDFIDDKSNPTNEVQAFIKHWLVDHNYKGATATIQSPEKLMGGGADYFVVETGLLIEATQLIDNSELARSARWSITVNALSKLIKEGSHFSSIKGLYSISTPETFGLKTSQIKNKSVINTKLINAVNDITSAILAKKSEVEVFGITLKIEKVSDKDDGIYFSTIGRAKSISVSGTFHENLKNKFEKANTQLKLPKVKTIPVNNRVLLIVNKYRLLTFDWELFDGLSYSYTELVKKYKNIDEIWFQVEKQDGSFEHKLLYKKSLFAQFENLDFSNMTKEDYEIFAKWFSALEKLDDDKKKNLIEALKILLKGHTPHSIFPDSLTRIEMVRYGRWLAENGNKEDADWLVKQFIGDPDPIDPPTDDLNDDGNKLHNSILTADKPNMHAIHTVKGHLAWTVQMLALRKDEYLLHSFEFTRDVLKHTKHLYVILQWIFPLIEISNRRFWLKELNERYYFEFKKLCFGLLDLYAEYPDIAKGLVHVFHYLKELTTDESKMVLEKLRLADDYEALLLYFAVYRERHFKEDKYDKKIRAYDPSFAKKTLEGIIISDSTEYTNLRSGIAWNIWKILSEDDKEFDTLSPLVDKFLTTPYDNHLYHNFERIVEDQMEKHTDKCMEWFIQIIFKIKDYLSLNPNEGRNVWLSTKLDEVLRRFALCDPNKLFEVVGVLYEIWMKGAYIGDISEIFTTYQAVQDSSIKSKLKRHYKELYAKMKEVNPKLMAVDWSK